MRLPIINFRDISGYRNKYGEKMKPGMIFRGGPLDQLSAEDVAYMEDTLGIRYILDYRDAPEAAIKPDAVFAKAEHLRIGAMKGDPEKERQILERQRQKAETMETGSLSGENAGKKADQDAVKGMDLDFATRLKDPAKRTDMLAGQTDLTNAYRYMVFDNPAFHAMFERLLRGDGHMYFHCSAGKDRTGLSAMLIMMALGMNEEDIVHEYMLSNEGLRDVNIYLRRTCNISDEEAEKLAPMLGVVEKNIRVALAAIYEKYESVEAYLAGEYGICDKDRQKLRCVYCE